MSPHAVPLGCPSSPPRRDLERSLFLLPVDSIRPNPDQPRRTFGREELQELTLSIAQVGLIQPLTVRPAREIRISGAEELTYCLDGECFHAREITMRLSEKRVNFFGPKGCSPNATATGGP